MTDTNRPDALAAWKGLPPRRWASFEDEDHRVVAVTDDEAADYIAWPEMDEHDVAALVAEHNAVVVERVAAVRERDELREAVIDFMESGGWDAYTEDSEQAAERLRAALHSKDRATEAGS